MVGTFLVTVGENAIVDLIEAKSPQYKFIAWGTTGTAISKSTTQLPAEAAEARVTGTITQPSADQYQVVGTITCAGAGKTITNAGLFDVVTANSGNLLIAGDFTGIALNVGDKIEFTFLLEIV